ncbi:MAG: FAD-dependent oxidoreductase [Candidatus Sungiibacteriota bacterium]
MEQLSSELKHIIIVGAGFAGINTALVLAAQFPALKKEGYDIILIDRHHHHLYTPALYEIAAIPAEYLNDQSLVSSILIPLHNIIRGKPVCLITDELIRHDDQTRTITLRKNGILPYAYLVIALGTETNYFNIPGLQAHSVPLKTSDDAVLLRNTIESIFKKKSSLAIMVGGGGASGVEVIAELVNFVCLIKEKVMPDRGICDVSFTLAEASDDILPGFHPWIVARAHQRLQQLGVSIKTGVAIASRDPTTVSFADGTSHPCDILVWTGGVKGTAILANLNLPLSPKSTLIVDNTLRTDSEKNNGTIFAVGDSAWLLHPETQKPLPWNVQVAEREGRHAGHEILRAIQGRTARQFQPRRRYPFILAVGKKYALADLVYFRFGGLLGWCAKQLVEMHYFLFLMPWPRGFALWWKNSKIYQSND